MKRKGQPVFRPRTGTSSTAAKAPTVGAAMLANFDGGQLLLLAQITRARRQC